MMPLPEITLSRRDLGRLRAMLRGVLLDRIGRIGTLLQDKLSRARIVRTDERPPEVVALGSIVRFRDDETGRVTVARLVYPTEVSLEEPCISVLTPVGAALIGLSEGSSIGYEVLNRQEKTLTVLEVLPSSALTRPDDRIGGFGALAPDETW